MSFKKVNRRHLIMAIGMLLFISYSCTTTPLSFTGKRIIGTWIRTPINPDNPESVQKWSFHEDGQMTFENNLKEEDIVAGSGNDPSFLFGDSIEYQILKPLGQKFLLLKMPVPEYSRPAIPRHIAENDSLLELYLASLDAHLYFQKWEIIDINKKRLQLVLHSVCLECGLSNNAITLVGGQQIIFIRE